MVSSLLSAAVLTAAVLAVVGEGVLAWRALVWLRRHNSGEVLARESRRVCRLAAQSLNDAVLAALAALGGAVAVVEICGPWLALPAAVVIRAVWGLPFAKGRHPAGDLAVALPVAGLAGLALHSGLWWLAAWAGWSAVVLWREVMPAWGRRLIPAPAGLPPVAGVGLWVVEGATQLNARAEGIGWRRRIVFNDSLVAALPADQLAAVVAHEAGHLRGRHREWFTLWRLGLGLAAVLAAAESPLAGLVLLVLAVPVVALAPRPLETWMIRRWEKEADRHAASVAGAEAFADALEHLYGANATAPQPEPWWAAFHHPHPVPALRLAALRRNSTKVGVVAGGGA